MSKAENPYQKQPTKAFWRKAVASHHFEDIEDIWEAPRIEQGSRIATAGSCFAQHIGRHIRARSEESFLDLEPAPAFIPKEQQQDFGFNLYSCRYGNIYTSRQLLQLLQEATGERPKSDHVWERDGRFFDALRPSTDPVGQDTAAKVLELRERHLHAVRDMLNRFDVFVFTMGLTESWISPEDGTCFPSAPGTIAGDLAKDKVEFHNLTVAEVKQDMEDALDILKKFNSDCKVILTVSPVPLVATATKNHVLSATTYSKSVLRAVAGELEFERKEVHYFPSYELITANAGRGYYFDPNLRTVNDRGVNFVMENFFSGAMAEAFPIATTAEPDDEGVVCDEEANDVMD